MLQGTHCTKNEISFTFAKMRCVRLAFFQTQLFTHNFWLKHGIEISKIFLETLKQWLKIVLLWWWCQTAFYGSKVRCLLTHYFCVTLYRTDDWHHIHRNFLGFSAKIREILATPVENNKSSRKKCSPQRLFDQIYRGFKNVDLKIFRVRPSKKITFFSEKSKIR